ncbi:Carbonate dehydratase [Rippkaea orientalis PCC 8801]|uniref:Carbonic anhydrase n=1 Tax=Rippkaea orientalis (strain PCC 8801 / RF-1) TaxID=41431 RepID=B7JY43_RIPO1|nr:carbonic anhydrase family protein [Rippkaea orientalis]ACK67145.1 Carbonate dehydratase [Rippkaea orientalis PCC 8801]
MINRRSLLKALPLGLAGTTFSFSFPSLIAAVAGEKHHEWNYEEPHKWGELTREYQACKLGQQQSPIDLESFVASSLQPIEISYQQIPLRIVNNGHTIQINTNPGNYIIVDGEKFDLLQFHFHHPSEHSLKRETYPMELHLVHQNKQGTLAVLAVFLKEGQENTHLKALWEAMPSHKIPEKLIDNVRVSLEDLLPKNPSIYRYFGSLTTPPCSEIVHWVIFQNPLEISATQIQKFHEIFPLNARPTQPINRRFILSYIS